MDSSRADKREDDGVKFPRLKIDMGPDIPLQFFYLLVNHKRTVLKIRV